VYVGKAEDGAKVAVKVVPLRDGGYTERQQRNRELEIASHLSTIPSDRLLVPIDYGYAGDDLLIVMPLADRSLKEAIDLGLSQEQQYQALLDVAFGLQELSEAAVLHRDLKSRNVLAHQGIWKIADFGISRDLSQRTGTNTFIVPGSWPYMAPELWRGQHATVKTDLYAYGCLAFELLSSRVPFPGPDQGAFLDQHLLVQPPELSSNTDPGLARLTMRLLAKEASRRPQDARAVVEELLRIGTPLTAVQERLRSRSVVHQQRRTAREAREQADRAAAETRMARREQALSDLEQLLINANEFLSQALPDLREQALEDYSLGIGDVTYDRSLIHRFVLDDAALEFQVWLGDAQYWRNTWSGLFDPNILDPIVSAGEIVVDILGDNEASQPIVRPLGGRLVANLIAEERSGRIEWFIYHFTANPHDLEYYYEYGIDRIREELDHGKSFGLDQELFWKVYLGHDERFKVAVEPLTGESIATLLEGMF
jgi:serine/threonine protein kinase